jgi:hypothetical protein
MVTNIGNNMDRLRAKIASTTTHGNRDKKEFSSCNMILKKSQPSNSNHVIKNGTPKSIVFSSMNKVLDKKKVIRRIIPNEDIEIINQSDTFQDKLDHSIMNETSLLSDIVGSKSHTNKKRRLIISLCERMKKSDPSLVRLRLGCEEIDDLFLKQIARGLRQSIYTKELILYRNSITDEGVKYLVYNLKTHPNLNLLSLGGNLITDTGEKWRIYVYIFMFYSCLYLYIFNYTYVRIHVYM